MEEKYVQKEGTELCSQSGRRKDSRNMSAGWGRPGSSSAFGQGPKDQLWPQSSKSDRPGCREPVHSPTSLITLSRSFYL